MRFLFKKEDGPPPSRYEVRIEWKNGGYLNRYGLTYEEATKAVDDIEALLKSDETRIRWANHLFDPADVHRVLCLTIKDEV